MRYNSKKDWWIGAIVWIPMILGLVCTGYVSFIENQSVLFFIIFTFFFGFVSWIWFGVKLIGSSYGMEAYLAHKEKGISSKEARSLIESYVCSVCGKIELKAKKPEVFANE